MRPASGQPVYTRLYRVTQVEVATYPKDDPAAKKRMPNYEDTRYQAGTEVLTFVSDQYFCMRRVQRNADGTPVVNEVPFEEQLQLYPLKQVLLSDTVVTDPEEAAKMVSDTLKLEQRQPRKDGKPIGPFTAASTCQQGYVLPAGVSTVATGSRLDCSQLPSGSAGLARSTGGG